MVSSRESLFWKKNTAFSAECKEKGSVFLLLPLADSPSQSKPVGFARFPLLSLRDIFPRSGGSLSSKGEPRALPETFSLLLKL